jgi:8-oxo-dGTP diphosphatase
MDSRPVQSDGRTHGVVAAIRREDGRWLLIRRSALVAAPGKICFPGGAVEVGEDLEAALHREMKEELGVAIKPVRQCWRWDSGERPLTLFGWVAEWIDGELRPEPGEVAEVLWLTAEEAAEHPDAMSSNRSFVECLLDWERTEEENDKGK